MFKGSTTELKWRIECVRAAMIAGQYSWNRRALLAYSQVLIKGLPFVPNAKKNALKWLIKKVVKSQAGSTPFVHGLTTLNFLEAVKQFMPPEGKRNERVISNIIEHRRSDT